MWSVSYYMSTCIAGVHMLTFVRIHYDQLFGLHPSVFCLLSWTIGFALGLPCLTNGSIVDYDKKLHYCLWMSSHSGLKFLAYLILLGILLPVTLTTYAYVRILAIFYKNPVVFETLGIFKTRYIIFGIILTPLLQLPFFIIRFVEPAVDLAMMSMSFAFLTPLVHGVLYGLSMFMMQEDDMALTTRSHKAYQPATLLPAQQV